MNECTSKKNFIIIKDISISGNQYISKEEVLSRISLKIGDVFSKEKIEKDMKAVYDLGYFKDVKTKLESFQDGCKVIFVVVENLLIKEIIIQGNIVVSVGDIREMMVLKEGKILSRKILKNDLDKISELYKAKEFLLARIEEIDFDDKGTLLIKLSEGRIEKIKIIGNKIIDQKIIQGEIEIKAGDIFNFGKVKKSLQKVYNLGYFDDVSMSLEPGSEKDLIVLVIKIVEINRARDSINFLIKNILAVLFLLTVYVRLLSPKLFYRINMFCLNGVKFTVNYYLYGFVALIIFILFSYYFFEKRFNKKRFFMYFFSYSIYILTFPLIVFYHCISFIFFSLIIKSIELLSRAFSIAKNILIQIFLIFLDIFFIFLIMKSINNMAVILSMSLLMVALFFHLGALFDSSSNPNLIYFYLFNCIEKGWINWKERELRNVNNIIYSGRKQSIGIDIKGLKLFLKISLGVFKGLEGKINFLYRRRGVLFTFIIFFVVSILLTMFIFSFEYYGLSKMNSNSLLNLTEGKYFDHLFFSMSVYSTVNPGNIVPLTVISKIFIMLQILIGIIIFYIFIISFQFLAKETTDSDRLELLKRVKVNIEYLEKLAKKELNTDLNDL